MSVESQEVIRQFLQEDENHSTEINNQLINASVSVEMQKRRAEENFCREKECETLRKQVESTIKENKLL